MLLSIPQPIRKRSKRSIRLAPKYEEKALSALFRNNYPNKTKFAESIGFHRDTIVNFFKCRFINFEIFKAICEALALDWQEISTLEDREEPTVQDFPILEKESLPFVTDLPIDEPNRFFGRKEELERIFELLKGYPLQNVVVIGEKNVGKTSLLLHLRKITISSAEHLRPNQKSDWLTFPEKYRWAYVDFQDPRMGTRERLLNQILVDLGLPGPNSCNIEKFMDCINNNLRYPSIILLDEIDVALKRYPELDDSFWEGLRSLASHSEGKLGFILASRYLPQTLANETGRSTSFFNIFGCTVYLDALTEEAARELIASSPIPFCIEDTEWILSQSKCLPRLVQILCREHWQRLKIGKTGNKWRLFGLQQIQQYLMEP